MTDYSVTKNYPLDSVILWEKYLVYGAALGISLKALSQLPIDYSKAQSSGSGLLIYSYGTQGWDTRFNPVKRLFAFQSFYFSLLTFHFLFFLRRPRGWWVWRFFRRRRRSRITKVKNQKAKCKSSIQK
ncbi:hypothetical protein COU94_04350 [Candidatus Shapirobacteria bacterium CG10_big_fil_rev_8_21_14_0_10_38_8]|nr:MAG: hypothetical protein COU94_04350 [Candidatus Shapirobacteria bacterium CG10_big_fil_rev_8_21_14_0_10_38_8]